MDLSYPIGKYEHKASLLPAERETSIAQIAATPQHLRDAVAGLSHQQFDTPYRPGGWTVRQVVHHVPDSHLNSYVRFKLALTENEPMIKPYDEALWAKLQDSRDTPVEVSLTLLEALHHRWEVLLRSLHPEDFARRLRHPELGTMTLDDVLGHYAWHGRHHVAHITSLRDREGWRVTPSMSTALRYYWATAKGYRLRPWASPYLRWRLETFFGGDMHTLGPSEFFGLLWRERARFKHFLAWVAVRHRAQNS